MGIPMNIASRPPLRRLLILDRLLRANRYPNARSAARELEVNPRTVHRDLEFLRDSWGAPLEFCHKHNGYYYRDAAFALPLQTLTEGELFALFLAERVLHDYRATPYARDLAAAFRKLTAALPESVTIDLAHWDQVHSFRRSSADLEEAACFHQLAAAVRRGRRLELVYWTASRDDTTRRVVDPYHLVAVDGHWYLVAYCHLREDVRMFAPARVRAVKETGRVFERPADFRIADYLDTTFRVVRGHAIEEAKRYEIEQGRKPVSVEEENCGCDITALKEGQVARYIEVKGRACAGAVALTPNEWIKAQRFGQDYWLYIGVNCKTKPEPHLIQDPGSKLDPKEEVTVVRYMVGQTDWQHAAEVAR
jgi:predicted DNA-binding transcriptional regulator YafY